MLLVDFSGTIYAAVLKQLYLSEFDGFDEGRSRHVILSSIKKYKKRFSEYGRPIIIFDSKNYWRKDLFPYYKGNRKVKQDADTKINWPKVFTFIDKMKEEIKANLPFVTLEVAKAEADDIIARLCHTHTEQIMIVSRDHDLIQLQRNGNVKQYNPVDDRFEATENINKFLFEHICEGDKGDGIPNIMSPDNSYAIGARQKPLYQKKITSWWDDKKVPVELLNRFETNRKLIDLRLLPDSIKEGIDEALVASINKKVTLAQTMKYFRDNELEELTNVIGDFF